MHSSISNSEDKIPGRKSKLGVWVLLGALAVMAIVLEAVSRFELRRVSPIANRITREYRETSRLTNFAEDGKPTVLLLGNSLLLEGVDFQRLRHSLADQFDLHRLVFEQTEYLDEYYTLETLFRNGSRPHDVVLCISVKHFLDNITRGEYMAQYMDAQAITELSLRKHSGLTTWSSYMLADASDWFANRAEIRKAFLGKTVPGIANLTMVLAWQKAEPLQEQEILKVAPPRLRELKALCDRYHTHLAILVPPNRQDDYAETLIKEAAQEAIAVLVPVSGGTFDGTMFRDGFHLNAEGAAIFTTKLEEELPSILR